MMGNGGEETRGRGSRSEWRGDKIGEIGAVWYLIRREAAPHVYKHAFSVRKLRLKERHKADCCCSSLLVQAYSTVGTPDYIAPEVFKQTGYTYCYLRLLVSWSHHVRDADG